MLPGVPLQKIDELGGKVVTISGPDGYIYDPSGVSGRKIDYLPGSSWTNNDVVVPYAGGSAVISSPMQNPGSK